MRINLKHSDPRINEGLKLIKSPESERSIVKGVPLESLEAVKTIIKEMYPKIQLYVKYRGPRKEQDGRHCLRRNAKSAAIYCKRVYAKSPSGEWIEFIDFKA